jgi:MYXO-CTERM domain-containing protein
MLLGLPASNTRAAVTLLIWALALTARGAAAAPIKVACIGEHTTHSHAFPAGNREAQPVGMQEYPAQLQTLLGSGYDVRNFGDCCATVLQGYTVAETHPYIAGTNAGDGVGYKESIAFLPDVVIIGSWGRHDWGLNKAPSQVFTLQGFSDGYEDLIKRYQALATHPKIFISLPIPILNGQGDMPDQGVKTMDVLPTVNAVADKYKLPVVDLYTPFFHHTELFKQKPDPRNEGEGEHVTDAGLTVIANAVYAAMQKDLMGAGGAGGSAGASSSGGGGSGGAAAGAAGAAGVGGTSDTTAGSGGASTGGTPGTAGQVAAVSGQAGTSTTPTTGGRSSATPTTPSTDSDAGCGCRAGGETEAPSRTATLLSGFLLLGWLARRRR